MEERLHSLVVSLLKDPLRTLIPLLLLLLLLFSFAIFVSLWVRSVLPNVLLHWLFIDRGYVECSGGPSGLDGILVPGI